MLRGEDLWLRHGARAPWVLRGASVTVAPGEVVGIHGPSGCGKTTLARVLAGFARPVRGSVSVDGHRVGRGPRPVQLVHQHPERAMNPRWRIGEILAEAGDGSVSESGDLVEETWHDRHPHELSGGELQRVSLARALRATPRYLIADEISSSLDPLTQVALWGRIADVVQQRGTGVLVISHDLPLLAEVCDRVLGYDAVQGAGTELADGIPDGL